ncbi:MAG: tetratricopeptide repeat protein [Deltaproteobacteria bacterium]|nr:tetratricopeptide repeat protein [Deltaproteobacteria bacterium]
MVTRSSWTFLFTSEDPAFSLLRALRERGVSYDAIDQGYHEIDYSQPGPNMTIKGAQDGEIDPREVYEYLLDHADQYRDLVNGLGGKPLAWELDDLDPKTNFDAEIRAKVQGAIDSLDKILRQQGLTPGTDPYKEKMAVGLFYFALLHRDKKLISADLGPFLLQTAELADTGLDQFQFYLTSTGGLGLTDFTGDAPVEATALEALVGGVGYCTEKINILFAAFRQAGLDPFFVYTTGETVAQSGAQIPETQSQNDHIYLGLTIGQERRFFDPTLLTSKASYPNNYPLRPIHYLAMLKMNRGNDFMKQGKTEEGLRELNQAASLQPNLAQVYLHLGSYYSGEDPERALANFLKARTANPNYALAHAALSQLYFLLQRFDEAITSGREAVRLNPNDAEAHLVLVFALNATGKVEEEEIHKAQYVKLDPSARIAEKWLKRFSKPSPDAGVK